MLDVRTGTRVTASAATSLILAGTMCSAIVGCHALSGAQEVPREVGQCEIFIKPELTRLISLYPLANADARAGISDYFLEFAEYQPRTFFATMREHRAVFEKWLVDLPRASFTDYGGCTEKECLRQSILNRLGFIDLQDEVDPGEDRELLQQLRSTLEVITVTHKPI